MASSSVLTRTSKLRMQAEDRLVENGEQDVLVLLGEHRVEDSVLLLEQLQHEITSDFQMMSQPRYRSEQRKAVLSVTLQLTRIVADHLINRLQMFRQREELHGSNRRTNY